MYQAGGPVNVELVLVGYVSGCLLAFDHEVVVLESQGHSSDEPDPWPRRGDDARI
jgi:hypothetical protein